MTEGFGFLMISKYHEKDLISLLETLKDTTESQRVMNVVYVANDHANVLQIAAFRDHGCGTD